MGLLDLFSPSKPARSPEAQARVDALLDRLTLYHFATCPYCVKVRRTARRLGLDLEMKNIKRSRTAFDELVAGGGKKQVPCLRIEEPDTPGKDRVRWLYESDDINRYLEANFA